jgi:hypothetical protein
MINTVLLLNCVEIAQNDSVLRNVYNSYYC